VSARAIIVAALLTSSVAAGAPTIAPAAKRAPCQEDLPCWNWASMGDHRRGARTIYGDTIVAGPCVYAKLRRAGYLTAAWPMKGDALALRLDCRGLSSAVQTY
jgi:hypothetical protein